MKEWFFDILRDPKTGDALGMTADGQCLEGPSGRYGLSYGVPLFVGGEAVPEGRFDYAKHYDVDAEQFDYYDEVNDRLTATHLRRLRETVMRMVPRSAELLLDVGCGKAFVASHLCPRGVKVVSMDIAKANACKAVERYGYDNHAAVVADAYHLPFADQTFDCIIASEIIEHTVDPQGFLASLLPKLKSGGTLIVATPYRERIVYSLCIHCNCKTPHNAHLHSFDKEKMRRMVAALPAEVEKMRLVGNKLLLRSHLTVPLSMCGYRVWRLFDRLLNGVAPKAEHFVIVIKKR